MALVSSDELKVVISDFRGRFNRGDDDAIPPNYSKWADNVAFDVNRVGTRPGTKTFQGTVALPTTPVVIIRQRVVNFSSGLTDTLTLYKDAGNFQLYSSLNNANIITRALTPTIGDFKVCDIFDRIYISFFDATGLYGKPIASETIYVYDYGKITAIALVAGGAGYAIGDVVSIDKNASGFGTNATIKVATLGGGGAIATFTLETGGTKYTVATPYTSTKVTGAGSGATFNVTAVGASTHAAAGGPPSVANSVGPWGGTITAAAGAAGTVEAGRHLIAVAYETDTGYITSPGPVSYTLFNAPGSKKIDLTTLPIGPAGTVARHILCSKQIFNYNSKNFNQKNYEMFFIPNGRIADNTRVAYTIDFIDSQLVSSADYLIDQKDSIPAGPILTDFNVRLLSGGADKENYVLRGSKVGAPESFAATDGFSNIYPDDGGGQINEARESRGLLYIAKFNRTYVTSDTDNALANWKVNLVDGAIGCLPGGISQILDSKSLLNGALLVLDISGLRILNGSYDPNILSFSIDNDWDTNIAQRLLAGYRLELVIDSTQQKLYITALGTGLSFSYIDHRGSQRDFYILVGDFQQGLSPQYIKWSFWYTLNTTLSYPYLINGGSGIGFVLLYPILVATGYRILGFYAAPGIADASSSAEDQALIEAAWSTNLIVLSELEMLCNIDFLRLLALGSGTLLVQIKDRAGNALTGVVNPVLGTIADYQMRANASSEAFLFIFTYNSGDPKGNYFQIRKLIIFGDEFMSERPM